MIKRIDVSLSDEFLDLRCLFEDNGYEYNEAFCMAIDQWIKEKRYKDLYIYLSDECSIKYINDVVPYLKALLQDNEIALYKNYWRSCLKHDIESFWSTYSYWKTGIGYKPDPKSWRQVQYTFEVELTTEKFLSYDMRLLEENKEKYPAYQDGYLNFIYQWHKTLEFIDTFIEAMQRINNIAEIEKAKIIKESIYNLQKPKPKKTTDKRKMDEEVFWNLIETSRNESDINSEFLELLQNKLEAMSATEIKKFKKYLLEKMNELYHWDIWALAYIVRGGCGDDAFDYFRAWVVSKGKDVFEMIKNMQIESFKEVFSQEDPQLEEFMYVANEAYENKKSESMSEPRVKSIDISGTEWDEESVCTTYPKLCEIFTKNRT